MGLYPFVVVILAVAGGYFLYRRTVSERERKGVARRPPSPRCHPVARPTLSAEAFSLVQQPPPLPPKKGEPKPFSQEQERPTGEAPTQEPYVPETKGDQTATLVKAPASVDLEVPSLLIEPDNIEPQEIESVNQGESRPPSVSQSETGSTAVPDAATSEDQIAIEHDETGDPDVNLSEVPFHGQPSVVQDTVGTSTQPQTRIDPIKRGGRARVEEERPKPTEAAGDRGAIQQRPELICWKHGAIWQIGVAGEGDLQASQGERTLVPEASGPIPVSDLGTGVAVQYAGQTRWFPLLSEKGYLLFKMRQNWGDPGRLVSQFSAGYYVIIAAEAWKLDEALSGKPPIAPEKVEASSGARAHFMYLQAGDEFQVALVGKEGSDPIHIYSKGQQFQLVGRQINDSSVSVGPLFGREPPKIEADSPAVWDSVSTIVCGQEGARIGGWRTQFTPVRGEQTQTMPVQLANTSGWYFVRVYNQDEDLVESFDFRFCRALIDLRWNVPFLPGPSGHQDVVVECEHQPGLSLFLDNHKLRSHIRIEAGDTATVLHIPPVPECDETKWTLRDEGNDVSVVLRLPRLWWGVDTSKARQWLDRPTVLSADVFKATSKQELWIKALGDQLDSINIGFNPESIRSYAVKKSDDTSIPLRDFADAEELEETSGETVLSLYSLTEACDLLTVRDPWKVSSLEIVQHNEGEDTILKLGWQETGDATHKEIHITRASDHPVQEPLVVQIGEDDREQLITAHTGSLPPGEYRIEFGGNQRLGDNKESVVGLDDKFSILPPEELLQHAHITIESLHSQHLDHKFDLYTYTIDVVGRIIHGRAPKEADLKGTLVKETNDGWYIGHLQVRSRSYQLTEDFVQNPIKFEYLVSKNRITAIEDHDGDGAVFCPECKWMVWRQRWQQAEHRRRHKKKLITDFELDICAEQRLEH